jgi:hypothetical protein
LLNTLVAVLEIPRFKILGVNGGSRRQIFYELFSLSASFLENAVQTAVVFAGTTKTQPANRAKIGLFDLDSAQRAIDLLPKFLT